MKQPTALRLADMIEQTIPSKYHQHEAAAELRRLYAIEEANEAMLEALKSLDAAYERLKPPGYPVADCQKKARAAIAKGEAK